MTIHMNNDHIVSVAQLAELIKVAESLGVEQVRRQDETPVVYE